MGTITVFDPISIATWLTCVGIISLIVCTHQGADSAESLARYDADGA